MGTYAKGVYQVELNKDTKLIKKTTAVSMLGKNSIPMVYYGFSQKIDDTHYLIGTYGKGVYQIVVNSDGMITKNNSSFNVRGKQNQSLILILVFSQKNRWYSLFNWDRKQRCLSSWIR